jgi:hypothetical protein
MASNPITEQDILEELQALQPAQWSEVLDFIGYLKHRAGMRWEVSTNRPMTAQDLLDSGLVGLWEDRDDIGDSLSFARQLRLDAEHRDKTTDGTP